MPFQQRTNTSWRSTRSQPADSRRLFRCLGAHLLRSPWNVKAFRIVSARVFAHDGQTPPVECLGIPAPEFVWHCQTSSRRHVVIVHRLFTFRCRHSPSVSGKQKTPLARSKQGVEILFRFVTCLPPDYPNSLRGFARDTTWIGQG